MKRGNHFCPGCGATGDDLLTDREIAKDPWACDACGYEAVCGMPTPAALLAADPESTESSWHGVNLAAVAHAIKAHLSETLNDRIVAATHAIETPFHPKDQLTVFMASGRAWILVDGDTWTALPSVPGTIAGRGLGREEVKP